LDQFLSGFGPVFWKTGCNCFGPVLKQSSPVHFQKRQKNRTGLDFKTLIRKDEKRLTVNFICGKVPCPRPLTAILHKYEGDVELFQMTCHLRYLGPYAWCGKRLSVEHHNVPLCMLVEGGNASVWFNHCLIQFWAGRLVYHEDVLVGILYHWQIDATAGTTGVARPCKYAHLLREI